MATALNEPGASDYDVYKDGFHDRLSRFWPEPREQLHAGGWARTREMLDDIKRLSRTPAITHALDLCCGEGATAVHVAATEGWEVTGVDIVDSAIKAARALAEERGSVVRVRLEATPPASTSPAASQGVTATAPSEHQATGASAGTGPTDGPPLLRLRLSYERVADRVRFACASVHYLPLPSDSYDLVYGQDPDGLANPDRIHAFREVHRVLRPGGLFYFWHHWIPGPGWPAELLAEYAADPVTASPRLSHEAYVEDLKASGLQLASATHVTPLALRHMGATAAMMRAAHGGELPDAWLGRVLHFAERGGTMGILAVAYKPSP